MAAEGVAFRYNANVLDLFAGAVNTLLSAHAPNLGAWSNISAGAPKLDGAGGLWVNSGQVESDLARSPAMSSDNQLGQFVVDFLTDTGDIQECGLKLRYTDDQNWYSLDWQLGNVFLAERVGGLDNQLAVYAGVGAPGERSALQLEVDGTTLVATIDGVAQDPETGSALPSGGAAVLILGSEGPVTPTTGVHMRQILTAQRPA